MGTIQNLLTDHPLLVLDRHASALDAARAMTERVVGATLIVDAAGKPAGIFTERDLMTRVLVAGLDPAEVELESVMTRQLLTAHVDEPIEKVQREMQRLHVRHLPVVDATGRVIALLSSRDLLRHDLERREQELREMHDYISGSDAIPGSAPP